MLTVLVSTALYLTLVWLGLWIMQAWLTKELERRFPIRFWETGPQRLVSLHRMTGFLADLFFWSGMLLWVAIAVFHITGIL